MNAIIVKFGNGMNAKWDSDAVQSGDMGALLASQIELFTRGTVYGATLLSAKIISMTEAPSARRHDGHSPVACCTESVANCIRQTMEAPLACAAAQSGHVWSKGEEHD
ncbi:hypothetical protein [Burkholderia sp. Ac-20344]|uniref:hypothetical protein n=1 Tax=Burkholderia sp. Ac-20344 TaxID=2703890 RepID=UPI00197BC3BC|nr:hypothetical protein [Burkholderia sp. Ac-20344]MBN3837535.1 hypothetical protein [Burkholderia sp. Ac-20344]